MSIVLNSSGGGSVTINEPSTASNFTQTLPTATGTVMVSGNMPAFSAYLNSTQSVTSSVITKVAFDIEEFDTNNNFASSRFTPTVAGYYQINSAISSDGANTRYIYYFYKNGSVYKRFSDSAAIVYSATGAIIVYLNGSTDYIEVYGQLIGTSSAFAGGSSLTYINGSMVRSA